MTVISKTAVVPYTPHEMYALVNDIESYPAFLPWCNGAQILARGDGYLTASISMQLGKLRQRLTTENTMLAGTCIDMRLVEGPFKRLNGCWRFDPNEQCCRVALRMDFEFKNTLVKHAVSKALYKIINSLMEAFIRRAETVYGKR